MKAKKQRNVIAIMMIVFEILLIFTIFGIYWNQGQLSYFMGGILGSFGIIVFISACYFDFALQKTEIEEKFGLGQKEIEIGLVQVDQFDEGYRFFAQSNGRRIIIRAWNETEKDQCRIAIHKLMDWYEFQRVFEPIHSDDETEVPPLPRWMRRFFK